MEFSAISIYAVLLLAVLCVVAAVVLVRRNRGKAASAESQMDAASASTLASALLAAVGGKENVTGLDYCTTRLRFEVRSYGGVNEKALKEAGASSVVRTTKTAFQVVVGSGTQPVYDALRRLL